MPAISKAASKAAAAYTSFLAEDPVAGPSAASSVAEHEPTTAVSTTLITSEESKAASVGTIKRIRSAV
jgi:hypothetical protein